MNSNTSLWEVLFQCKKRNESPALKFINAEFKIPAVDMLVLKRKQHTLLHMLHCTLLAYCSFQMMNLLYKVKVKLSLYHEDVWESRCIAPRILNLGTRWWWKVSFRSRPLYPRKRAPGIHGIGGWMGLRAGLDSVAKRNSPSPYWESTPVIHPVA
jgi:hypothetical protein